MKPRSMQIVVELQIWHGDALKEHLNFNFGSFRTHTWGRLEHSRSQSAPFWVFNARACTREAATILCMWVVNLLLSRVMHKILEPPTVGFLFSEVTFMALFGWCAFTILFYVAGLYIPLLRGYGIERRRNFELGSAQLDWGSKESWREPQFVPNLLQFNVVASNLEWLLS